MMITQQDDIKVIEVKDYIKNPKPNGYRSYHMIVEIPVFFAKGKTPMRVELQIRTESTQPVPQYLTAFPIPVKTDLLNADIQS